VDESRLARAIDEAAGATDDDLEVLNEGGRCLLERNVTSSAAISVLQRAESAVPPAIETDDEAFGADFSHRRTDFERRRGTALHLLGYAFANLRRLSESEDYCRRALAADSTLVPAYLNLATVYLQQGRSIKADSVLAEVRRRYPDHPTVREAFQALP